MSWLQSNVGWLLDVPGARRVGTEGKVCASQSSTMPRFARTLVKIGHNPRGIVETPQGSAWRPRAVTCARLSLQARSLSRGKPPRQVTALGRPERARLTCFAP